MLTRCKNWPDSHCSANSILLCFVFYYVLYCTSVRALGLNVIGADLISCMHGSAEKEGAESNENRDAESVE